MNEMERICEETLSSVEDPEKSGAIVAGLADTGTAAGLFNLLYARMPSMPPERAGKLGDVLVALARRLDDTRKLYDAYVIRGYAGLFSGHERAAKDCAAAAMALFPTLGVDMEKEVPWGSFSKDALVLLSRAESAEGFAAERRGISAEAQEHYMRALGALQRITPGENDAWYYVLLGDSCAAAGEHGNAILNYKKALAIPGSPAVKPARLYSSIGSSFQAEGKYEDAERYYGHGITAAKEAGDHAAESAIRLSLAGLYNHCMSLFDRAKEQARMAAEIAPEPVDRAIALQLEGAIAAAQGHYRESLDYYERAAKEHGSAGDSMGQASALSLEAHTLSFMGRHEEALGVERRALSIYGGLGYRRQSAVTICNMAMYQSSLGDLGGALASLDEARNIAEQIGDDSLTANCYVIQGDIYLQIHSPEEAGRCYNEALYRYVEPYHASDPYVKARSLAGLGSADIYMGDLDGAEGSMLRAVDVCAASPALATTLASMYSGLADVLKAQGRLDEAKKRMEDSLGIYERLGMRPQAAGAHLAAASLLSDTMPGESVRHCETAAAIYEEAGVPCDVVSSLNMAATVLFNQCRIDDARIMLEKAEAIGAGTSPISKALTYQGLGIIYEKSGDERRALFYFKRAVSLIDSMRATLAPGDIRLDFQGQESNLYSAVVRAMYLTGDEEGAYEYAEKAKSRVLIEQIGSSQIAPPPALDPQLVEEESALLDELNASIRNGGPGERAIELDRGLAAVWDAMKKSLPSSMELDEYLSLRRGDTTRARDFAMMLDGNAAALEYYTLKDRLLIFFLSREGGLKVFQEQTADSVLKSKAMELLASIRDRASGLEPLMDELSQRLLAPAAEALDGFSHVHIIPHGFLHQLPFHALPVNGRPFMEQYGVSYSHSGTLLQFCMARPRKKAGRPLVVGDTASGLTFAGPEARKIAGILGCEPLLGKDIARDVIQSRLEDSDVVSFSCHAAFNRDHALASAILLPDGERLTARELYRTRMPPGLVTLSACESGMSGERPGDEMLGLVRSFMFAGARSVVASLWRVDDLAAYLTMTGFYENHYKNGMDMAEALRSAQVRLRDMTNKDILRSLEAMPGQAGETDRLIAENPDARPFAHPFYWSPFILIGDRR